MERAAEQAEAAGLTGLLVTPGPDLFYFTGYQPTAITDGSRCSRSRPPRVRA